MANIWKRKDRDTWVVDFREATGQRVRLTARSREEAEEKLAEKIKESRKPVSLVENRDITLMAYAQGWLETAKLELALRTSRSYKQLLDVHVLPVLGHLRVRDLHQRDVKKLLTEKRQSGLGKNTVRLIKAALSTVLSEATEDELIQVNPALAPGKKKKRRPGQAPLPDVNPMSHAQLAAFKHGLDEMQGEGRVDRCIAMLLALMAGTGLRPSEALALRPGDLNLRERSVRVERAMDLDGRVKPTKTEETRSVDLSDTLIRRLSDYVTWLEAEAIAGGQSEASWLFPGDQGRPLSERYVRRVFERALRKAELPHFRVYDLRHTYASILLSEGVPLLYVSIQLGHSKPTTTLRYYAKWIPSGDRRYVDVLDREVAKRAGEKSWHQNLAPKAVEETEGSQVVENVGGPCRDRTCGPLIKSQFARLRWPPMVPPTA